MALVAAGVQVRDVPRVLPPTLAHSLSVTDLECRVLSIGFRLRTGS